MPKRRNVRSRLLTAQEIAARTCSDLGSEHPDSLAARVELARAYRKAGRSADARTILEDVLSIRLRFSHPSDHEVLRTKNLLGLVSRDLRDYQSSTRFFQDVVADAQSEYGDGDDLTFAGLVNLAETLEENGQFSSLTELHRRIIDRQRQHYGENHLETLRAIGRLAKAKRAMGDPRSAQEIDAFALMRAQQVPHDLRTILDIKRSLIMDAVALDDWDTVLQIGKEVLNQANQLNDDDELKQSLASQRKYLSRLLRQIEKRGSPDDSQGGEA